MTARSASSTVCPVGPDVAARSAAAIRASMSASATTSAASSAPASRAANVESSIGRGDPSRSVIVSVRRRSAAACVRTPLRWFAGAKRAVAMSARASRSRAR